MAKVLDIAYLSKHLEMKFSEKKIKKKQNTKLNVTQELKKVSGKTQSQ